MKLLLVLAIPVLVSASLFAADRPNFVIILADDKSN